MSVRALKRAQARRLERERRRAARLRRGAGVVASVALGAAVLAPGAQAAGSTYTVTTLADDSGTAANCPPDSITAGCSLRDALTAAGADSSADTITFASGLSGTLTLTNGALPVTSPYGTVIQGPGAGAAPVTVDAGGTSGVFDITGTQNALAADTISGLTLTRGSSSSGGAISDNSERPLTLDGDVIENSSATSGGGGVYAASPLTVSGTTVTGNSAAQSGGGIQVLDGITVTGSTVSGNTAAHDGGGIVGPHAENQKSVPFSVIDSTVSGNTAGDGGGIYSGSLTVTSSHVTGNQAIATSNAQGGGLDVSGTLTLQGSTVSGNTSAEYGGGIALDAKYGTTEIQASTISGNTASVGGGAWFDQARNKYGPAEIQTTTISGNQASFGAGIDVYAFLSPLTVSASTISGNQGISETIDSEKHRFGATFRPEQSSAQSYGGGILLEGDLGGPFKLVDSTVSGNTADVGGGVSLGGTDSGEPLYMADGDGSVTFDNSTIAANTASRHGGGIFLGDYSTSGDGAEYSGNPTINSTIVAGNTAAGVAEDLERAADSTSGGFISAFSLIQTPAGAPLTQSTTITGEDPQLGPLQDNGGPTLTMLPASTSPAIDQGLADTGVSTDQRGDARTVQSGKVKPAGGDGTDIGAVERPVTATVPPTSTTTPSTSTTTPSAPTHPKSSTPTTPATVSCTRPVGTLSGHKLGVLSLGEKRSAARAQFAAKSTHGRQHMDYFCPNYYSLRVAYGYDALLRPFGKATVKRYSGRAVLLLTSGRHFTLRGVRAGMSLPRALATLHVPTHEYTVGANQWYLFAGGSSEGVLQARHGVVTEVGIAVRSLNRTVSESSRFLRAFLP